MNANETKAITLLIDCLKSAEWNTHHAAKDDDANLNGLAESIKAKGMIHRVVVRETKFGDYEIIDGHRRVEAAAKIGWRSVPCEVCHDVSDEDAQAMTAVANIQRLENDPLLEAELIARLAGADKAFREIAAIIGKDERYVARRARLINLTSEWRAWFADSEATVSLMEFVASYEKETQNAVFKDLDIATDGKFDEDEIEHAFKRMLRTLDEDTEFDIDAAGCNHCEFNTATHGFLFPVEEDEDVVGKCQKSECYIAKWNAATDAKIESLRAKKVEVKEAKQKWDIPSYWGATPTKDGKHSQPWVYTESGVKRLVWVEPRVQASSTAPALTEAEKAEQKRIKKAHAAWDKLRKSAYAKIRDGIKRDEAKAKVLAEIVVGTRSFFDSAVKTIVGKFTCGYAYDSDCQQFLEALDNYDLNDLGITPLTEKERDAVNSDDPALAKDVK